MLKNNEEAYYQDDIDLRKIFNSLLERKFFISVITIFVTAIAIQYALTLPTNYIVSSSFTSPNDNSVLAITGQDSFEQETSATLFSDFLTNISNRNIQKKVFIDGDFLTLMNPGNELIDDVELQIAGFVERVKISPPAILYTNSRKVPNLTELPYKASIVGKNPEFLSLYLKKLIDYANFITVNQKISNRLEEISLRRDLIIDHANKDRLAEIERIKEEDSQRLDELLNEIDSVRSQAEQERLNQIALLTSYIDIAKSLGIKENNFKMFKDRNVNSDLTISIGENNSLLPEWYLYGENALVKRLELLKNRKNNDPFIPKLAELISQKKSIEQNPILKTLIKRVSDTPFIPEINVLDVEKLKLESKVIDLTGFDAMQLSQDSFYMPIKSKKIMIVLLSFILSLVASILLALFMNALRPDNNVSQN